MANPFNKPRAVKSGSQMTGILNPYTGIFARKVTSKAMAGMTRRRLGKKALQNTKDKTRKNLGYGKMY